MRYVVAVVSALAIGVAMLAMGGVQLEPISPWNYLDGSFEGIYIDPDTGSRVACGDPRRTSQAYGY